LDPLTIASKAINPAKDLVLYLKKKWFPPKIGYQMAPSNILEIIGPYVHHKKVEELLGFPHEIQSGRAAYRFANALLQINYDGDSIKSVTLVTLRLRWPNRFRIFPFDYEIGKSKFSDIFETSSQGAIDCKLDYSSKFFCLWKQEYFGHPGRYFYYSFSLLSAATYPTIEMPEATYEAITQDHIELGVRLTTIDSKFNAITISTDEEELFGFDFTLFN